MFNFYFFLNIKNKKRKSVSSFIFFRKMKNENPGLVTEMKLTRK